MKKSAYTTEEFLRKVKEANPKITVVSKYKGVAKKVDIVCEHAGTNSVYAYTLFHPRVCCKEGYHTKRIPVLKKSINERKDQIAGIFKDRLDVSAITISADVAKIDNIKCNKHNIVFSQWIASLRKGIGCPECGKENKSAAGTKMILLARQVALDSGKAGFVSKAETKWLDELNVSIRQKWLTDVRYSVDGYDADTNTVYLYHGRFWHGCIETYEPDFIHPILKVTMKQLYEQTLEWEQKIKDAGYNLVTIWG